MGHFYTPRTITGYMRWWCPQVCVLPAKCIAHILLSGRAGIEAYGALKGRSVHAYVNM